NSNTLTTGRPALRFGLSDVSHVTSLAERPRARQGTRRPSGACGRMPQRARAGRRRARPLRRGTNQRADRSVPPSPPSRAEREAEVLEALGAHRSNAQIAGKLYISVRTVESHVSSLLRKFGVADRRELAELAQTVLAPATPPAGPLGLPAPWTSFVGRDRERDAINAALQTSRLVSLVGPGGAGKTRLA